MADMKYRILRDEELPALYDRLKADGLLWCVFPEKGDGLTRGDLLRLYLRDSVLVLGGFVDGTLGGFLVVSPYRPATRVAEIGVCAMRGFFNVSAELCLGGFRWAFEHLDMAVMVGHVPAPNLHVLRMLEQVGFHRVCRLPDLIWFERKGKFVDGWFVMATQDEVRRAEINVKHPMEV